MPEKGSQQTQPAPPPPSAGLGRGFPDLGLSLGAGGDQAMLKWLQHQATTNRSSGGGAAGAGTTPVVGSGGTVIVTVGGGGGGSGGNATTVASQVESLDAATAAANVAFGVPRKPSCDSPLPSGGGGVVSVTGPGGPLASLHAAAAARGLFGVNRINPLFLEDSSSSPPDSPPPPPPSAAGGKRRGGGGAAAEEDSSSGSDGCGGGKSGSSGYGEHSSSDGGCASSSGGEEETPPKGSGAGLSVLRRDSTFVSSICIPPPNSPGALLSPIPEGVGADAVPRPVWPRSTASSSSSSTSSRNGDDGNAGVGESPAEEALRRLSLTLSGSRHVERVTRALSHKGGCSSSSGAGTASTGVCSSGSSLRTSPSSGSAASSREGSLRGGVGCVGCPGSSSSGFSELTPPGSARRATPHTCPHVPLEHAVTHEGDQASGNGAHSAAQVAAAALLLQLLPPAELPSLPPPQFPPALVQLTAPHATSPAALRNAAFVYGTLRRPKGYERMGPALVDVAPPSPPRTSVALPLPATDVQHQGSSKRDGLYSFGCGLRGGAPDFTLDVARAERLLRKIREAKQRRCACRLLTCTLALAVFLAAVVAVSMVVTRGQRVFGPI